MMRALISLLLFLLALGVRVRARAPIIVVGSINADVIVPLLKLPKAGETVSAKDTSSTGTTVPGGKGANQAVAVSRLGAPTIFVGQFGNDSNALMLESVMKEENIDLELCKRVAHPSGMGLVLLLDEGGSTCIVTGGSNMHWAPGDVSTLADSLSQRDAACILLQMEVPHEVNEAVAAAAERAGSPVFQDVGGADRPLPESHLRRCLYLSPNLTELRRLTQLPCGNREEVLTAARSLQKRGARNVLVTLGEEGCLLLMEDGRVHEQEAIAVENVVDETGAGDNFRAAFCVAHFADKKSVADSLRFAAAAAAVSVQTLGAIPSCCRRADCEALLRLRGGSTDDAINSPSSTQFPLKFASRLNSMFARLDLEDGSTDAAWPPLPKVAEEVEGIAPGVLAAIRRQGRAKGLDLVDFNYPQHLLGKVSAGGAQRLRGALAAAGLGCGAVCLRFPKEMQAGALSSPDETLRARAVEMCLEACEWATALGASDVVIWSAFCGYDYPLQADYNELWGRYVRGIRTVCDRFPKMKVSLEFKPTDENTRFFTVPSTGAALLLAKEVNRRNFGLTLDFGHCLLAGENPAQSVAMVSRHEGRGSRSSLFGVQLGDGYGRLGAEDGLAFGSVHYAQSLEFVYHLVKTGYQGHVYFDTFPRNEDPVRECEYNIRAFKRMHAVATRMLGEDRLRVEGLLRGHDAMGLLEYLEELEL